ncbi:hypothetical protein HanIR_Chr11g0537951 [Helianthus annuus]|nr:hypothetical protein HanIR_Chr11g0537951 [Helianthus annuus]
MPLFICQNKARLGRKVGETVDPMPSLAAFNTTKKKQKKNYINANFFGHFKVHDLGD